MNIVVIILAFIFSYFYGYACGRNDGARKELEAMNNEIERLLSLRKEDN